MAHDVFISHSAKDKTIADAVCATLESAGVRCWIAPRDVMPGMEWGRSIIEAIEQARIMILVFTANANASPQIRREVERAVNHDVAILPFRVENILPDKSLEYFIGNVHWLDALTPPIEKHIERLVGTVRVFLAQTQPREEQPAPPQVPQQPAPSASSEPEARARIQRPPRAMPSEAPQSGTAVAAESAFPPPKIPVWAWVGAVALALALVVFFAVHSGTSPTSVSPPSKNSSMVAGTNWRKCQSGTTAGLDSVFATSDGKRLWAVDSGDDIVLESDDGGTTWTTQSTGTRVWLESIFGTSDGAQVWAVGVNGPALESDDRGVTWAELPSVRGLSQISGTPNGKHLWAVGENNTVSVSNDGGGTWLTRKSGASEDLLSIFGAADGERLWTVGAKGTIVESDDGGATWMARNSGTKEELVSIFAAGDGSRLWVVGDSGTILESDDGGASWVRRASGTRDDLGSIFGTSDGKHLWIAARAYGRGTILESDDGGVGWRTLTALSPYPLNAIFGTPDGKHLWAVGNNGTILESDSDN